MAYLEARTSFSDLASQIAEETRNSNHMCVLCFYYDVDLVSELKSYYIRLYSNARAVQRSIDEGRALSSRDSIAKTALKLIP